MAANDYTDFYTNCEYGIALWAAEALLSLKEYNPCLRLHVVSFEKQADKWTPDWRNRYFSIHERADSAIILKGGDNACNQYLIEHAGLIMHFDSQDAKNPLVRFLDN
jgi:uncharacterized phage-like protein YoqJ